MGSWVLSLSLLVTQGTLLRPSSSTPAASRKNKKKEKTGSPSGVELIAVGRTGTQLVSGAQVRLSPSEPPCTDPVQDQGGRGAGSAGCAVLAHPDLVCRPHAPRDSPSLEDPLEEGPSFSGDGHNLAPASRSVEPACVASGRDTVDLSGLPQAVIETITQSRAPSTRQAYALRWGLFVD
ncbi:hypothetical protein M9458_057105, partial [Cirrhinus mrigala]